MPLIGEPISRSSARPMRYNPKAAFGWIETPAPSPKEPACSNTVASRPRAQCERSGGPRCRRRQLRAKRTRHFLQTFVGRSQAAVICGDHGQYATTEWVSPATPSPAHDPMPTNCFDRTNLKTGWDMRITAASSLDASIGSFEHQNQSRGF
jgi:hypothetical protein